MHGRSFHHPRTGETLEFTAEVPAIFEENAGRPSGKDNEDG